MWNVDTEFPFIRLEDIRDWYPGRLVSGCKHTRIGSVLGRDLFDGPNPANRDVTTGRNNSRHHHLGIHDVLAGILRNHRMNWTRPEPRRS